MTTADNDIRRLEVDSRELSNRRLISIKNWSAGLDPENRWRVTKGSYGVYRSPKRLAIGSIGSIDGPIYVILWNPDHRVHE